MDDGHGCHSHRGAENEIPRAHPRCAQDMVQEILRKHGGQSQECDELQPVPFERGVQACPAAPLAKPGIDPRSRDRATHGETGRRAEEHPRHRNREPFDRAVDIPRNARDHRERHRDGSERAVEPDVRHEPPRSCGADPIHEREQGFAQRQTSRREDDDAHGQRDQQRTQGSKFQGGDGVYANVPGCGIEGCMTLRVLYLHGFASGPDSAKGRAVAKALAAKGMRVEQPDLNVPSFEKLSVRAQLKAIRDTLLTRNERTLLVGSSLGGYLATLLAPRALAEPAEPPGLECVAGLVLLAPAFNFARRWRARMTADDWDHWKRAGTTEYDHFAYRRKMPLRFEFLEEAAALPSMPGTSVPVYIVQGRRDDTVPYTQTRAWVEMNPQAKLIEVDDDHQLLASLPVIEHEVELLAKILGG